MTTRFWGPVLCIRRLPGAGSPTSRAPTRPTFMRVAEELCSAQSGSATLACRVAIGWTPRCPHEPACRRCPHEPACADHPVVTRDAVPGRAWIGGPRRPRPLPTLFRYIASGPIIPRPRGGSTPRSRCPHEPVSTRPQPAAGGRMPNPATPFPSGIGAGGGCFGATRAFVGAPALFRRRARACRLSPSRCFPLPP